MNVSRRAVIGWGAAVAAGLTLSGCKTLHEIRGFAVSENEGSAGTLLRSSHPLPRPFAVPLPVPAVLAPTRSTAAVDYYDITQRATSMQILPGKRTTIWGYNGTFPGPTLVSRSGRETVVTHHNELGVPVVVHLHGGRTPPQYDGYPDDMIMPAHGAGGMAMRTYHYPMDQPAGTLWYHDHRMDFTGPQVYRGLAGFHLVRDEREQALGLPAGGHDVPLMIADRSFDVSGELAYPSLDPGLVEPGVTSDFTSGVLGDCILVNGAAWPVLDVDTARYRFRLLNASNARRYLLTLDPVPGTGGAAFTQIGSDAHLLAAPIETQQIPLAQGERADVIVDFSAQRVGDALTLRNELGADGTDLVVQFRVARKVADTSRIPRALADVEVLREQDAVIHREFWFAHGGAEQDGMVLWTVNGDAFSVDAIAARPLLGSVEHWTIHALNVPHPFHIHLAPFQVVAREGDPGAPAVVTGWKDTVSLDNGGSAEILIRFDGYRGKYVFHCHNLEHEDMRMMANFEVV